MKVGKSEVEPTFHHFQFSLTTVFIETYGIDRVVCHIQTVH